MTGAPAGLTILGMRPGFVLRGAAVFPLLCATAAPAQSLVDVARQEAERRKVVVSSGKVYTNDSLRSEPPPLPPPPAAEALAAPSGDAAVARTAPEAAPAASPVAATPVAAVPSEAEWRTRVASAREALSRAQMFAEALQSRINALTTDFVNRDDPAQRDVVAADRQKALAELDRVRQEIGQQQKAVAAIQEDARRAGVPAGWVR